MKKYQTILTYLEWLIIYCLMAIGIRVIIMFIQNRGHQIEISLKNLGNSLYLAAFLWLVHTLRGEIPWRPRKSLNPKKE
jgi:hypothetical protein